MLRLMFALVLCVPAKLVMAADLAPIRSEFVEGYDVSPYRISIVMARHKAAVFDVSGYPEPLMNPTYGHEVLVDEMLHRALRHSMVNALNDPENMRFGSVRMMTNSAESVVVACGTVQSHGSDDRAQPFVAVFTNPHADSDVQSTGFANSPWIIGACHAMGIN